MKSIKAGIVGAAGYGGGEMLRILLNHPEVDIHFLLSSSSAGKPVYDIHTDLLGDTELRFDSEIKEGADVIFLCLGHGDARKFLNEHSFPSSIRIIDLSQDFRLHASSEIASGQEKRRFTYGLPELNRNAIKTAENIANPGCFATCIQLALLPLAAAGLLKQDIHISAVTGSTGAGQALVPTTAFTWRENNLSVYKAFTHQHLNEIGESISQLAPSYDGKINFIPYRGDYTRGIIASVYTDTDLGYEQAFELYQNYYSSHPFTWVSGKSIDLKQVVNTNKDFLYLEKSGDKLLIVSILDNLLKGASGQAVQNMNLMFGLDETTGLHLKAIVF